MLNIFPEAPIQVPPTPAQAEIISNQGAPNYRYVPLDPRPNNVTQQIERLELMFFDLRHRLVNKCHTGNERPPRNPQGNNFWYDWWFNHLSPEERSAELELRRKGWYNYEGDDSMVVPDKNGKDLHTEDVVTWQEKDCVIVCILSETELQLNPLGEGLPELVHPSEVELKHSFIEKLRSLRSNEELLAIIHAAERRLEASKATAKPDSPARKTVAPKPKAFTVEL